MSPKNTFKNYIEISDINKGKILPLELKYDENSLRMRLDNKQLFLKFNGNDNIDIYYLDRFEDIKKENIANSIGKNQLENIFNSIKSETIEKYHYSLDNLLKSILND